MRHVHFESRQSRFNIFILAVAHLLTSAPSLYHDLQIKPCMAARGGFETGSRIPVNTIWPEDVPRGMAIEQFIGF